MILIVILASNVCSSHAQNANQQQHDSDYISSSGNGMGVVSSGEVMASRLPVLNGHEPSCEELRAMWR